MRVLAVAVTYNPDTALLTEALRQVAPQVQGTLIVDNGSGNAQEVCELASAMGMQVIANGENIGIAAAQNQGVNWARKNDYSHVLLLDQDTVLSQGVVEKLLKSLETLERNSQKAAAIGPAYFERNSEQWTRAYRAAGLRLSRISLKAQTQPVASDFIIASGSLIPLDIFEKVGTFRESLFIDLVDVEWCFRARASGYAAFIAPTACVDHHLGSGTVKVGPRQIAVHVPIRNYYWVRNALWLARQPYTPIAWRLYFIVRSLAFLAAYPLLADKRALRLKLIGRGFRDSLMGRFGRLTP